jgi:hypothetical protein
MRKTKNKLALMGQSRTLHRRTGPLSTAYAPISDLWRLVSDLCLLPAGGGWGAGRSLAAIPSLIQFFTHNQRLDLNLPTLLRWRSDNLTHLGSDKMTHPA